MKCPSCGAELPEWSGFCTYCGASTKTDSEPAGSTNAFQPNNTQGAYQPQATNPYGAGNGQTGQSAGGYGTQPQSPYGASGAGAYGQSGSFGTQSQSAYGQSGSFGTQSQSAYGQSGSFGTQSQSPYGQSGSYGTQPQSPYGQSGSFGTQSQSPYGQSSSFGTQSQSPYGQSGSFGTQPQSPYGQSGSFGAQSPYGTGAGSFGSQGTTPGGAYGQPVVPPKKKTPVGLIVGIVAAVIAIPIIIGIIIVVSIVNTTRKVVQNTASYASSYVSSLASYTDEPESSYSYSYSEPDIEVADKVDRTILLYFIGSNLETDGGCASDDIDEILSAYWGDNVNVILQTGGARKWENPNIEDGKVQRFELKNGTMTELQNLGVVSMVEEYSLIDFLEFGMEYYPADHYALVMWDHGGGIPVGFGVDELDTKGETLTDVELGNAIRESGIHLEALIFDACNMCTLEVAMSVMDSVDYLVAAESYVNGVGISYTNWMNRLASGEISDPRDYCEIIVSDYMDSLKDYGMVGSMSVIKMSRIPDVYNAYANYMASVNRAIGYGDYAGYKKARGNCGLYDGTDSVDLITLATNYSTDYSTPLINAVVNAVVYTESDIAYGHGLTAYSPYEYYNYYSEGRDSLVKLGYDDAIVGCYDSYISMVLAYQGSEYVDAYGGDWYDSSSTSGVDTSTAAGDYDLDVTDMGGYLAICLTDSDWDIVENITCTSYVMMDDTNALLLGEDYQYLTDDYGYVEIADPSNWVYVNDSIATFFCLSYYHDYSTGAWSQEGIIYAQVNGHDAVIRVYYDDDYPYGTALGYTLCNFDTGEVDSYYYSFDDYDIVDLVYVGVDMVTGEETFETNDEPFYAGNMELHYYSIDLAEMDTAVFYTVYDVYGNTYTTDTFFSN